MASSAVVSSSPIKPNGSLVGCDRSLMQVSSLSSSSFLSSPSSRVHWNNVSIHYSILFFFIVFFFQGPLGIVQMYTILSSSSFLDRIHTRPTMRACGLFSNSCHYFASGFTGNVELCFLQIFLLATVARILSLVSFEICIIFYAFSSLSWVNLWWGGGKETRTKLKVVHVQQHEE